MRHLAVCATALLSIGGLLSAQNILNNGGFEFGLMCYGTNVWSDTGVFGKGDYRLKLSPDARSGAYSLEIGCSGADCPKAAAISNRIPTEPGQNYRFSVQTKCPVGAIATVYIPGTSAGDRTFPLNCTGSWTLNAFTFRIGSVAHDFLFYLFSYNGPWVRFDDVVLTYADGSAHAPMSLHAGNRKVEISNQTVLVDGAPYLALGFFDVNYTDLAQVAALGANTVFGLGGDQNAGCYNTMLESYQDRAYDLGLNFVPDSSTTARLALPAVFAGAMQKFAPHLANIAWMLSDEPDQASVPYWFIDPNTFLAESTAAKTRTRLPVFADFQRAAWSVASEVSPYAAGVDLFMAEPYGPDFQPVAHAAAMFRSLRPALPLWMAQDDIDAHLIVPKAYWVLVNGGTGISYFSWNGFKAQPDKLAAAKQVFSELGSLKDVIFGKNADSLVTGTAGIGRLARFNEGRTYVLAVNPVTQPTPATFQISAIRAGQQVRVLFENRTITATAGGFTDHFAGIARHVYVIEEPDAR